MRIMLVWGPYEGQPRLKTTKSHLGALRLRAEGFGFRVGFRVYGQRPQVRDTG